MFKSKLRHRARELLVAALPALKGTDPAYIRERFKGFIVARQGRRAR